MADTAGSSKAKGSLLTAIAVALLSAAIGFAAVYVTRGGPDNAGPGEKVTSSKSKLDTTRAGGKKSAEGDFAGFVFKSPPQPMPQLTFKNAAGTETSLSAFNGKWVLLNLWATWCAPCKAEMPALDRLQQKLGSSTFEVVALSLDRDGRDKAKKFLEEIKIEALNFYIDETGRGGMTLEAPGMPTTFLINPDGLEEGRFVGPAEWDSPAAVELIENAMKKAG